MGFSFLIKKEKRPEKRRVAFEAEVVKALEKQVDVLEGTTARFGNKPVGGAKLVIQPVEQSPRQEDPSGVLDLGAFPDAGDDDYTEVGVEEFGAALLRGMGWEGEEEETDTPAPAPRAALLGVGATASEGVRLFSPVVARPEDASEPGPSEPSTATAPGRANHD